MENLFETSSRPMDSHFESARGGLAGLFEISMRTGALWPLKNPSADAGRIFPVSPFSSAVSPVLHFALLHLRSSPELKLAGETFFKAKDFSEVSSLREGVREMWCIVAELETLPSNERGLEQASS